MLIDCKVVYLQREGYLRELRKIMVGTCKLCLQKGVALQRSHVIPAALYRMLRGKPEDGNPNPWIVRGKVQVQTSRQERAHLLCRSCERRLSAEGERWVFANAFRPDGTFPLANALAESRPISGPHRSAPKLYQAAFIPGIKVSAVSHFAASLFWRSSIHAWKSGSDAQVRLGPYEEAFRSYLMGETEFPLEAALSVRVRMPNDWSGISLFPTRTPRIEGVRNYSFAMPGLAFILFVGKTMPGHIARTCFVRGSGNPFFVSDTLEDRLIKQAARMVDV